jgi:cytochrome c oxidase subunit 1
VLRGRGAPAPQRPWNDPDGHGAEGLEWEVPSPAPFHTFETPPRLNAAANRIVRVAESGVARRAGVE